MGLFNDKNQDMTISELLHRIDSENNDIQRACTETTNLIVDNAANTAKRKLDMYNMLINGGVPKTEAFSLLRAMDYPHMFMVPNNRLEYDALNSIGFMLATVATVIWQGYSVAGFDTEQATNLAIPDIRKLVSLIDGTTKI